jgi:hypothetical protein
VVGRFGAHDAAVEDGGTVIPGFGRIVALQK